MKSKACVVITTIHAPTPAVRKYIETSRVDVIVVADTKTPADTYAGLGCEFLSLERQRALAPELDALLPLSHYARKNMGYLSAIRQGYETIIESDDDNLPLDIWAERSLAPEGVPGASHHIVGGPKVVNIYGLFTGIHIWPRGLPLRRVLDPTSRAHQTAAPADGFFDDVSILQGLADGDTDVDAIFRLTSPASLSPVRFQDTRAFYKLGAGRYCPANTQNTIWRRREDFPLLYVPSYVSFRFCDILKMYVAQALVRRAGRSIAFQGATVFQERNPHDFFQDFLQEIEMHVHVDRLIEVLDEHAALAPTGAPDLALVYARLVREGIVKDARELPLLQAWLDAQA